MGKYGTTFSHKLKVLSFSFLWGVVLRPLAFYHFMFHCLKHSSQMVNIPYLILIKFDFVIKETKNTQMFIWIIQDARGW